MDQILPAALRDLVQPFIHQVAAGEIEIYNEFSLQHEFGIFLRNNFPPYIVQFERNVRFFFQPMPEFIKHEIDITVFRLTNACANGR